MKFQLFCYFDNSLFLLTVNATSWHRQCQDQESLSEFCHYQNWSKWHLHWHEDFSYSEPCLLQTFCVQWLWLHAVWAAEKGRNNFTSVHPSLAYVECTRSFFIKEIMLLVGCFVDLHVQYNVVSLMSSSMKTICINRLYLASY